MSEDTQRLLEKQIEIGSEGCAPSELNSSVERTHPEPESNHSELIHEYENGKTFPQHFAALSATLGALAAGMVLGWTSPISEYIESGKFHNISVNDDQMGWIGSLVTLGAMSMCLPAGFLCDLLGTKVTLLLVTVPFGIGWAFIVCAKSVTMLYCGRFITGLAVGGCCIVSPLYTCEIAEKRIRGKLGTYFQLQVVVGIFFAYLVGKIASPTHYTLICAGLPLIFFVIFVFQPETPLYSFKRGKYDVARKNLLLLRGSLYNVDEELKMIKTNLERSDYQQLSILNCWGKKATRRALIISLGLMFFQQFSGINGIIFYTSNIFQEAGTKLDPQVASIFVGGFLVVATFVASLTIDKLGRKILLLISDYVMCISNISIGLFFSLRNYATADENVFSFLPLISLCIFVIVFSLGFGPIPWMISSELYTPEIRSIASATAGMFNWLLAFFVTKFFLNLEATLGLDITFYVFAVISLVGTFFVFFFVIETKGRSPEEIQDELSR